MATIIPDSQDEEQGMRGDMEMNMSIPRSTTAEHNEMLRRQTVCIVRQEVMGQEPENFYEKIWCDFDPFKGEQVVRSYNNYTRANVLFGAMYFIVILLYSAVTFINYFHRPVIETFSTIPSIHTNPIQVDVSLQCSELWPCSSCIGTWSPDWDCNGTLLVPTVSETYLSTPQGYCSDISSTDTVQPSPIAKNFTLTACYSRDFSDGILIQVPFSSSYAASNNPRMVITITRKGSDMFYQQFLEPAQRKSVFLGQTLNKHYKDPTTTDTYVADLFYDGKNSISTAELRIKIAQFSTQIKKSRPGSIWGVYGNIGGFSTFMLPVTSTVRDIFMYFVGCRIRTKVT